MDKLAEFFKEVGKSNIPVSKEEHSNCKVFDVALPGRENQIFFISRQNDVWTRSMAENTSVYLGQVDDVLKEFQHFALVQTKNAMKDKSKNKLSRVASVLFVSFEERVRKVLNVDTGHGRIYCTPAPLTIDSLDDCDGLELAA